MNTEEWRDVVGYEGLYQVSNMGRVKSFHLKPEGVILKGGRNPLYLMIALRREGKPKVHYIHRLVAAAFIGDIPKGYTVNHKDGCKFNNHVQNLEIITHAQNMRHAVDRGLIASGERNKFSKLSDDDVRQIRMRFSNGGVTKIQLAREYGISDAVTRRIIKRTVWRHVKDDL